TEVPRSPRIRAERSLLLIRDFEVLGKNSLSLLGIVPNEIIDDHELRSILGFLFVILGTDFPFCLKVGNRVRIFSKRERLSHTVSFVSHILCILSKSSRNKK